MKVAVLTTSYPRDESDAAGVFLRDAVDDLRSRGVDVDVVSPASFRHFGIAYGAGVMGNLRRSPTKVLLLPAFLAEYARAARRAAADADLVHAHWLPSGYAARATGKPYVLTMHGTDAELARRAPALFRPAANAARVVTCVSESLTDTARRLGAREVRVVPVGIDIPDRTAEPEQPAHVLFVGRLSEEKGVHELVEAARGLPLVVVGDGPLRSEVPDAVGFVPPADLPGYFDRAAVVVCPSRREGYGVVARQAMAHARPVVATAVGGLAEAIVDGESGLLVPPGDTRALREGILRLLGDAELRARLGAAARERVQALYSRDAAADATIAAYEQALSSR
ncbi:MAG TPA: glycosyltransferase family 4 protein [Gaiellaceae bacterium]|nr:glycosyltransferase family 4 protein [Gaiellaceae bacterium]